MDVSQLRLSYTTECLHLVVNTLSDILQKTPLSFSHLSKLLFVNAQTREDRAVGLCGSGWGFNSKTAYVWLCALAAECGYLELRDLNSVCMYLCTVYRVFLVSPSSRLTERGEAQSQTAPCLYSGGEAQHSQETLIKLAAISAPENTATVFTAAVHLIRDHRFHISPYTVV